MSTYSSGTIAEEEAERIKSHIKDTQWTEKDAFRSNGGIKHWTHDNSIREEEKQKQPELKEGQGTEDSSGCGLRLHFTFKPYIFIFYAFKENVC